MGFRFAQIQSADIPGGQARIDERKETRRSKAIDSAIGGLFALEKQKKEGVALDLKATQRAEDKAEKADLTQRQRALGGLNFQQKLANQGISLTEDQTATVDDAFQTGKFGGLSEILGKSAEAKKLIADENRAFKRSDRKLSKELKKSQIAKNLADPEQARKESEAKIKAASNKSISDIRKEVSGLQVTKDVAIIDAALGKLDSSLSRATAAGDLAGVFSFMKILDPGSVVRESEFANAARAAGMPDRIIALTDKVGKGTILTPPQRKDFIKVAKQLAAAQFETFKSTTAPQRAFVEERGLPGEQIFPQFGVSEVSAKLAQEQAQGQIPAELPPGFAQISPSEPEQVIPFRPGASPIQEAQAGSPQEEIITPERTQFRQSRIQELRAKAGL